MILLFDALVLLWLVVGVNAADNAGEDCRGEELCENANDLGTALGAGFVVFLWAAGAVILGVVRLVANRSGPRPPGPRTRPRPAGDLRPPSSVLRPQEDVRVISSVGSTTRRRSRTLDAVGRRSATSSRRRSIIARPISTIGWRTLVSGGSMWRAMAESS